MTTKTRTTQKQAKTDAPKPIVYFDLEVQRTAVEAGGWDNLHKMGISVAVALSESTGRPHVFTEQDIEDLNPVLKSAACVVGYNIRNFDFKVLRAYQGVKLRGVRCLDLMEHLEERVGHRLPLDALLAGTLKIKREVAGLEAIELWKEGKVHKVAEKCCNDVLAMCRLHQHGIQHGHVFYLDRFCKRKKVEVAWAV